MDRYDSYGACQAAAQGKQCVVVLETELTEELIQEGIAKDTIRLIQDQRKKQGCNFTDRISIELEVNDPPVIAALKRFESMILAETLGVELKILERIEGQASELELAENAIRLKVTVV